MRRGEVSKEMDLIQRLEQHLARNVIQDRRCHSLTLKLGGLQSDMQTLNTTAKDLTDKLTLSEVLDDTPDPQSGFSLRSALPSWLGGGDAPPQKRARE